ncbi:MAG: substrate-binding domain-containing protein [Pseudomonadota bacterium]
MRFLSFLILWCCTVSLSWADTMVLASTTSTQNSGLYDYLLPLFEEDTGIQVRVVAVGTGQAIRIAKNGDADALLVHHRPSEDAFIAEGFGTERFDIMYNDFVIVGPKSDPAGVSQTQDIQGAMAAILNSGASFISRGDDSGTHKREQALWQRAQLLPKGVWYREIGAGMGAALNMAAATGAYTLSDRGTWLSFGNKQDLSILFQGQAELLNPYGLVLLNPKRFPHVQTQAARTLAAWLTSARGQAAIGSFRVENAQLFCPNAKNEQELDKKYCPAQSLLK